MDCIICSDVRGYIQDDGLIAFQRDSIAFGPQLRQVVQYDLSNLRREDQGLGLGFIVSDDEQGLRSGRPVVGHDAVLVLEETTLGPGTINSSLEYFNRNLTVPGPNA